MDELEELTRQKYYVLKHVKDELRHGEVAFVTGPFDVLGIAQLFEIGQMKNMTDLVELCLN